MQSYPRQAGLRPHRAALLMGTALMLLGGCATFDFDLRNRGDGFTTATAAQSAPDRPRPDNRGVISYPNYQVAVAQRNDTVRSMASRLGLNAETLATYNGINADTTLRRDEIIALPSRVAEPSPATGAAATGPILPAAGSINVTELASNAIDRAAPSNPAPAPASPRTQTGVEPIRHQVARGETAYSLARLYGVPVRTIADWNGLGPDLGVREGQYLLIPRGGASAPAIVEAAIPAPGVGSATPVPPSAAAPLPAESPPPAAEASAAAEPVQDLGSEQTETRTARLAYPVDGNIIRAYSRGRNDGIDIGAAAGTQVRAAAAGTVAAITTNTEGVQIVVIRHDGDLLTVYTHIDNLSVERGTRVSQGQSIGRIRAGDPSFLHFEVRNGMESRDPTDFLP